MNEQLKKLIIAGKVEDLVDLIKENPSILEQSDEKGRTVLHYAAEHNLVSLFKKLKDQEIRINVNQTDSAENTLLHVAAQSGNLETCQYLFENGAELRVGNKRCETVLFVACDNNRPEIVDWLFHICKNDKLLKLLIQEYDHQQICPLQTAINKGYLGVIIVFNKHSLFKPGREYNYSPLSSAVMDDNFVMLECAKNFHWNFKDDRSGNDFSLMHFARTVEMAQWLYKNGCAILVRDKFGYTPLANLVAILEDSQSENSELIKLKDWYIKTRKEEMKQSRFWQEKQSGKLSTTTSTKENKDEENDNNNNTQDNDEPKVNGQSR